MRPVTLTLTGNPVTREVADSRLLVDFLREDLKLTGTKEGCGVGVCGACTVLLDGKPISACLALAVQADGGDLTRPSRASPRATGCIRCRKRS